jgi:hypothetical protein
MNLLRRRHTSRPCHAVDHASRAPEKNRVNVDVVGQHVNSLLNDDQKGGGVAAGGRGRWCQVRYLSLMEWDVDGKRAEIRVAAIPRWAGGGWPRWVTLSMKLGLN